MSCVTGKRQYNTQAQAEEGLITARSRFVFRDDSGPINVYQCDDCGAWHLTSKGAKSPVLEDPEIQKNISQQHEAEYWSRKFGR
jgi:hypothetical protein